MTLLQLDINMAGNNTDRQEFHNIKEQFYRWIFLEDFYWIFWLPLLNISLESSNIQYEYSVREFYLWYIRIYYFEIFNGWFRIDEASIPWSTQYEYSIGGMKIVKKCKFIHFICVIRLQIYNKSIQEECSTREFHAWFIYQKNNFW